MSPSHEQVLRALERVNSSEQFRQSERLRAFLSYIVVETLEGRGDRIKSYSIGLEVFRRHSRPDGPNDGVVRTTAIRLRDALERYYAAEGEGDDVIIELPKGGYVPRFSVADSASPFSLSQSVSINVTTEPSRWRSWKAIALAATAIGGVATGAALLVRSNIFAEADTGTYIIVQRGNVAGTASAPAVAERFSNELVDRLVGIGAAKVIGPLVNRADVDRQLASLHGADVMLLSDSLSYENEELSASWRLSDARSEVVLWSGEAQSATAGPAGIAELADAIAFKVLGTEGAVSLLKGRMEGASKDNSNCIPQSQRLAILFDEIYQVKLMECLEEAVATSDVSGEVWALLSQIYYLISENEASHGREGAPFVAKARAASEKAFQLSPKSFLTRQAQMFIAYRDGNVSLFQELSQRMISEYPGDPNLKIRVGARLVQLGMFEQGQALIESGITAKDYENPWDFMPLALSRIGQGAYADALSLTERSSTPGNYLVPLFEAISLAELGRTEEAEVKRDAVLSLRPNYGAHFFADAHGRGLNPSLIEALASGMRKAGFDLPNGP